MGEWCLTVAEFYLNKPQDKESQMAMCVFYFVFYQQLDNVCDQCESSNNLLKCRNGHRLSYKCESN